MVYLYPLLLDLTGSKAAYCHMQEYQDSVAVQSRKIILNRGLESTIALLEPERGDNEDAAWNQSYVTVAENRD